MDMIVPVASAAVDHEGVEDEDINPILCQSVANANTSINENLVQNVNIHCGNVDV